MESGRGKTMGIEDIDESILNLWEDFRNRNIRDRVLSCAGALADRDFSVLPVPTISEANRSIVGRISRHMKVYYWETLYLEELGILETLKARGNRVKGVAQSCGYLWSTKKTPQMPRGSVFMSTVCAVTMDGVLVKIQPEGVPIFQHGAGPELVIVVAGVNSIVDQVEDGFRRAKDTCIPLCAKRFGVKLPCVKPEHCVECAEPPPVCVVNTVVTRKPVKPDILVVLIGEYLGR
ncbi:MAG: lactate utilization protein [Actinobacteria bacterium]|nr:lactate utilization protein [Actinomycetota bacterium]MBU4240790.1 lactate utilization protein [Actinomycetota bacterium]MBU4301339.1 lactate utilization protein [Actinomycetota bacterium]MBU4489912.1 lactate utilization protein [Actinomycetota bacterium]MCG2795814.1 lactate utilization protein [Actinomycetes bacterium]